MQLSGQVPSPQRICVPAETLAAGCGTRPFPKYVIGLQGIIGVDTAGRYSWAPQEYRGQGRPDFTNCSGDARPSIQPFWRGRYDPAAQFQLSSVPLGSTVGDTKALARKAAGKKILSTQVGRSLVLRAEQRPPQSGPFEGTWRGQVTLKRLR